eukprot:gene725-24697_t
MLAVQQLQELMMPAALSTVAVVYSNIHVMGYMNKIRYAEEGKEVHPYKPWADADTKAEQHYRAYKACQNSVEWTVYMVPCSVLHAIYSPAIPIVGKYAPWCGTAFALLWAAGNTEYVKGYIVSAKDRLGGFKKRTLALRLTMYTMLLGVACSAAKTQGLLK